MIYILPSPDDFANLKKIHWPLLCTILLICSLGVFALFCAAEGHFHPWAFKQTIKIAIGFVSLLFLCLLPLRTLIASTYALYIFSFLLLLGVEFFGRVGMGGQRWVNLGFLEIQPSELMKISLILLLSNYFHQNPLNIDKNDLKTLLVAFLLILLPTCLVIKQPDLGTASLLLLSGGILLFLAGLSRKIIIFITTIFTLSLPLFWHMLHEYQQQRILTFFNPEQDPLGAGYHIRQSKISIGSGGFWGKGFLKGTQIHLDFLPEKHTDFILTVIAEEWGYAGVLFLIVLYSFMLFFTMRIALSSKHMFGRLVSLGMMTMLFLYIAINIGMVTGIFPVVGVPLPFISYGGASLLSLFIAFGYVMNIHIHKNARI